MSEKDLLSKSPSTWDHFGPEISWVIPGEEIPSADADQQQLCKLWT